MVGHALAAFCACPNASMKRPFNRLCFRIQDQRFKCCTSELWQQQRLDFEKNGFVHLNNAFQAASASVLLELLWKHFEKEHGVSRYSSSGWCTTRGKEVRLYGTAPECVTNSQEYHELVDGLEQVVDGVFGPKAFVRRERRVQIFANCPRSDGYWAAPKGWHTDAAVDPDDLDPKFIYAFAHLDVLRMRGGNTCLLQGSAKRLRDMAVARVSGNGKSSTESTAAFAQGNEWLARIYGSDKHSARELLGKGILGQEPHMPMVEMTGEPGDITLWDPHVVHSSSGNISDRPRSVIRFRFDRVASSNARREQWNHRVARQPKVESSTVSEWLLDAGQDPGCIASLRFLKQQT